MSRSEPLRSPNRKASGLVTKGSRITAEQKDANQPRRTTDSMHKMSPSPAVDILPGR